MACMTAWPVAQLLGLQDPLDGFVRQHGLNLRAPMSVHDVDIRGIERSGGADHMLEQRLPRQGLQHLGQVGMHPLALTCCEYDHGKLHDSSDLPSP